MLTAKRGENILANDMEILRKAYERETDTRDRRPPHIRSWEYYTIGASREDIRRLLDEGLIIIAVKTSTLTKYKLSEKGKNLVWATTMEREFAKIPTYVAAKLPIYIALLLNRESKWKRSARANDREDTLE